MNRIFRTGALVLVAAALLATPIVAAHESDTDHSHTENNFSSRLAEYKAKRKANLTAAQETKLKNVCKAAQGLVAKVGQRQQTVKEKRQNFYNNVISKLTDLSTKLKAANINTQELDQAIAELKTKVEKFNTDLAAYHQAIADLQDINCTEDTQGFKSILEAARAALAPVKADAQDIRTYLKDEIKPLLQQLRTQLEASQTNNEGIN